MDYNFTYNQDVQDQVEAFDALCAAMGWEYGSGHWSRLLAMTCRNTATDRSGKKKYNGHLEEAIMEWQQSRFAKVQKQELTTV